MYSPNTKKHQTELHCIY